MARLSIAFVSFSLALFVHGLHIPRSLLFQRDGLEDKNPGELVFSGPLQHEYFVTGTLGNTTVTTVLDFESSDLWVTGDIPNVQGIGQTAELSWYNSTPTTTGTIARGSWVSGGAYSASQGYVFTQSRPPNFDDTLIRNDPMPLFGIYGLGPSASSIVANTIHQNSWSPLDNALLSVPSHPYATLLLSPNEDDLGKIAFAGIFTVGKLVDLASVFDISQEQINQLGIVDLNAINVQGQLPYTTQTITVDSIVVAESSVPLNSSTSGTPFGKAVARLSTVSPYITVDQSVVDAIYKSIPGASWVQEKRGYSLPCNSELSVTITINRVDFLISPLDVVAKVVNSDICFGSFVAADGSAHGQYDIKLGGAFFHNAYVKFGYSGASNNQLTDPYVQLLPITQNATAHQQFYDSRASQYGTPVGHPSPEHNLSTSYTASTSYSTREQIPTSTPSSEHTTTAYRTIFALPSSSSSGEHGSAPIVLSEHLSDDSDSESGSVSLNDILGNIKYWVPSLIVGAVLLTIGSIVAIVFWRTSRRSRSMSHGGASAYKSLHLAETSEPARPLYGHDEERSTSFFESYSDK